MRAVASRWGGDARGTGPPAPAGLRHPRLSVRGRTGRGAAAQEPRAVIGAGRLVERAAISRGSRAGRPAGRRLAVSASAARRVTPTPPAAGGPQRSRGGRTTRRRSRLPGHRAARASPASAPRIRLISVRTRRRSRGRRLIPSLAAGDTSGAGCLRRSSPSLGSIWECTTRWISSRESSSGWRVRRW